jgi:hypothetical protein
MWRSWRWSSAPACSIFATALTDCPWPTDRRIATSSDAVQVGRALTPRDVAGAMIHVYPAPFGRGAHSKPPFPCDPHYDAKAWEQCAAGKRSGRILFWNVAAPAA